MREMSPTLCFTARFELSRSFYPAGILAGKRATAHPAFSDKLSNQVCSSSVQLVMCKCAMSTNCASRAAAVRAPSCCNAAALLRLLVPGRCNADPASLWPFGCIWRRRRCPSGWWWMAGW